MRRRRFRDRLVARARDWRWSSVRAYLEGRDDAVATVAPLFAEMIETPPPDEALAASRGAESIGRPLGSAAFLARLAALTGRDPRPSKRGPKPRVE